MGKFNNLTGIKFGRLTVISVHGRAVTSGGTKFYAWLCQCDCGEQKVCRSNALVSGRNTSCGCSSHRHEKHGLFYHPLYITWSNMIRRCYNQRNKAFNDYGGRGITVCDEWLNSVETFINHMISIGWSHGDSRSIDRIDNDSGYSPANTRLATKVQQARNTRRNTIIEMNGRKASIAEWAEELRVPYGRIQSRVYRGWSPERALLEPSNR